MPMYVLPPPLPVRCSAYCAVIVPYWSYVLVSFHCTPMRARKSPELFQAALNAGVVYVVIEPPLPFDQMVQSSPAAIPDAFDDEWTVPPLGGLASQVISTMPEPPAIPVLPPLPVVPPEPLLPPPPSGDAPPWPPVPTVPPDASMPPLPVAVVPPELTTVPPVPMTPPLPFVPPVAVT